MHIGFYNYYNVYNANKMFTDMSSSIGDDLIYPTVLLGQYAKQKNIRLSTIDTEDLDSYDAVVFIDFPKYKNEYFRKLIEMKHTNLYLIITESKIVRPDNWFPKNHRHFKKIFTWDRQLVDNKRYFKLNLANKIPKEVNYNINEKEMFCTLIAGNKYIKHPLELYSERIKAIRWFEQNHPEDFDLFGTGWDRYYFNGVFSKLNRFGYLTKLLRPTYPSYKGVIKSKKDVLKKYKYSICYENVKDISGYISEKIFDCMFAGCVPVYLGEPDINQNIPEECFIDKRNFKTYEELYEYIKNMPEKEYLGYLNAIKDFVLSDKIYPYSAECFADTIIKEVIYEK